jgi:hypothetical protein
MSARASLRSVPLLAASLASTVMLLGTVAVPSATPALAAVSAPTTTSLTSSQPTATWNMYLKFTATVYPAEGGGTVTFSIDGQPICSNVPVAVTKSTGVATCFAQNGIWEVGKHTLVATFTPASIALQSSTSAPLTQTITKATPRLTELSCSSNPASYPGTTTCTASVLGVSGWIVPWGEVSFDTSGNGWFSRAGCQLQPSTGTDMLAPLTGTCSVTYQTGSMDTSASGVTISARYEGNPWYTSTTSKLTLHVKSGS